MLGSRPCRRLRSIPPNSAIRSSPRRASARAGRAACARDAVVQHRHAVQPDLPQLLHRILAAQRPAGLPDARRSARLSRRDRARRTADPADRLHRRRAVHEPRHLRDAGRRAVARLRRTGADQRDEADAQAAAAAAGICATATALGCDPRLARSLHAGGARGRAWPRGSWAPTIDGLVWLARNGFAIDVAGRRFSGEPEAAAARRLSPGCSPNSTSPIDAGDPVRLMLFPEMDRATRRAGDHHRLLGHSAQVARRRDVRLGAHGGEAQGRGAPPSSPARCCPTTRSSSWAARWPRPRRRPPEPSLLRLVLRAGRRRLQSVTDALDVVIPTLDAADTLRHTLAAVRDAEGLSSARRSRYATAARATTPRPSPARAAPRS